MIYFVNINRHVVAKNKKALRCGVGSTQPPVRFTRGRHGKPQYAFEVRLLPPVVVKYDVLKPLPCGASAWLECGGVEVVR